MDIRILSWDLDSIGQIEVHLLFDALSISNTSRSVDWLASLGIREGGSRFFSLACAS